MNNIDFTLISWKRAFSEILILSWRNLKNWHMRWKISGIHEITWKFFILLCYSHILCNLRLLIWHHFGSFVSFNLSFANFRLHINSKHMYTPNFYRFDNISDRIIHVIWIRSQSFRIKWSIFTVKTWGNVACDGNFKRIFIFLNISIIYYIL